MNYYQAHKNKKPKKLKYTRLYKQQIKIHEDLTQYFLDEIAKLKKGWK